MPPLFAALFRPEVIGLLPTLFNLAVRAEQAFAGKGRGAEKKGAVMSAFEKAAKVADQADDVAQTFLPLVSDALDGVVSVMKLTGGFDRGVEALETVKNGAQYAHVALHAVDRAFEEFAPSSGSEV